MIKFFLTDYKLNAVDDKNRLVGFDLNDDCCAHGGWFIDREIVREQPKFDLEIQMADLPDYEFDPLFLEKITGDKSEYNAIVVKMIQSNPNDYIKRPDLYLHLYNVHNGYYAKGFNFSDGEEEKKDYV